jgi:hypothetical protein
MAFYTYVSNVSPSDGFDRIDIPLDNGQKTTIRRGSSYDLTATEFARARKYVVMVSSSAGVAPVAVSYLPIKGDLSDGQVPVWDSSEGAFVPGAGGGGGGGGDSNTRTLTWDDDTDAFDHPEWWADTSVPRQFVGGGTPPDGIDGITMTKSDTWSPDREPTI